MIENLLVQIQPYYQSIQQADTLDEVEQLRIQLLGKRGLLTAALKQIQKLPLKERPSKGQVINHAKDRLCQILNERKRLLEQKRLLKRLKEVTIDTSLPGRGMCIGATHPVTKIRTQLENLFVSAGFEIRKGPEIEEDRINFTALNIPKNHPARALHDTFYIKDQPNWLLRTHTSTVQIRALKETKPPFRIITTGAVYRCDSDVTHTPMFHQLEGMVVNQRVTFAELKGLLVGFLQSFFKDPYLSIRFRASYFPFTEPSAEVDIQCVLCQGEGCAICSHSGWLEILGCGMIHPDVFRKADRDPSVYRGYAFGMGIERLTLLYYRITDLRILFKNDIRLLSQFK